MRNMFAGLVIALGLFGGVTLAQQRDNQGTQPGAPGQPRTAQPAQPGTPGQPRTAVQPGQPGQIQPGQPGQPGVVRQVQPGQPGQHGQSASSDQQIAAAVYTGCHNHIEIAKFAQSKAQSEEARDFAEKMVSDHTPSCEEMKRLAGALAADHAGHAQADRPQGGQPRPDVAAGEQVGRSRAGGQLDWISIKKEIAQQCLKSTKEELSSKQGAEFDKCYIGYEISAHMKVVDELTVLKNHASSELKQKLEKSLQTAQQHLQLAKQIDQKLKDRPSERVSRRPEGNK